MVSWLVWIARFGSSWMVASPLVVAYNEEGDVLVGKWQDGSFVRFLDYQRRLFVATEMLLIFSLDIS